MSNKSYLYIVSNVLHPDTLIRANSVSNAKEKFAHIIGYKSYRLLKKEYKNDHLDIMELH